MVDRNPVVSPENAETTAIAAERLSHAFEDHRRLADLRRLLAGRGAHLVGGAVRDIVRGVEPLELDLAIEGDAIALALALDPKARTYKRYGTATVILDGHRIDLASTRTETYAHDGALPLVSAATIDEDLARRDFTINAMAFSLDEEGRLRDPRRGLADLDTRLLRVLHGRSMRDDPTRALRAARYSARLGFVPEPGTLQQIRLAPLDVVSEQRVEAELRRAAGEPDPGAVFGLLVSWGLAEPVLERAREWLAAGRG